MSENKRTYSDEEFGVVLRRAAELARTSDVSQGSATGLSLDEMKAIAAEAGLDPALVERAARLLPSESSGSLLGRFFGRRRLSASFPTKLTQDRTTHLLSVIRATTEWGGGEATASGLIWGLGGISVTMHNEAGGSRLQVSWTPRLALAIGAVLAWFSGLLVVINSASVTFGVSLGSIVAGLGVGLGTWATFKHRAGKRVDALMDAISRTMAELGRGPEEPEDGVPVGGDSSTIWEESSELRGDHSG